MTRRIYVSPRRAFCAEAHAAFVLNTSSPAPHIATPQGERRSIIHNTCWYFHETMLRSSVQARDVCVLTLRSRESDPGLGSYNTA